MDHNNPLTPVWQFLTPAGGGHTPRMVNSSSGGHTRKLNTGNNISSVKYVTNARSNMKIINIPSQHPTVTTSNDGTLLYGTPVGGSYLTVTNNQQQQQQVLPQAYRSTTATTSHATMLNESVLLQTPDGQEYLVDERSIQNIDQIPPENLIYMTASEELSVVNAANDDVSHLSIIASNPLELHGYVDTTVQPVETLDQTQPTTAVEQYSEECEVTEEVITDDWVQPQGEDCVQVTVDQLGVSAIVVEEDDIPVPLDQDQYTLSRPYPCDFCSRRFRKKSSLQNHLMAHSNDRPHCCNLCGAQYGHRSDLINHLKQHAYYVNEADEMSLRSDPEAEYDLPDLPNTSAAHSIKQRARRLSEDEDMYIQNSMVSYNSQPPMQLISTTNYGAGSSTATTGSSSLYGRQQQEDVLGHGSSYIDGGPTATVVEQKYIISNGPATVTAPSAAGSGKRAARKKASTNTTRTARTRPLVSSKTVNSRSVSGPAASKRQIKKEPPDNGTSDLVPSSSAPISDWRKPYVCQQCGASFARAKTLQSHTRTHVGSTRYDCAYCSAHFEEESQLRDHVQRAHLPQQQEREGTRFDSWTSKHDPYAPLPPPPEGSVQLPVETTKQYHCDKCSTIFFQLEHLLNHTRHAHQDVMVVKQELMQTANAIGREGTKRAAEPSTDPEAGEEEEEEEEEEELEEGYEGFDYAIEHYESREKETELLTCRDCGETFETAMDLLDHSEMHSGRCEPLECQLCGEKFLDETAIKQHVQDRHRHELTETSCVNCGKRCKSQTTLMKHAWDHSRERVHSCSKCGKTFHHMTRLKRHMDSHRNKAVRCEVCKEEFPDGRTLMNHRHSHTKSNEYPCHECGKTFGSRSSQQIHMRIHTGERPYACRFCWKAFADGGTLRKHERIHTGEKPYACPVCPKAFNQRVVLREHIRAHHSQTDAKRGSPDQKPYLCPVCSSPFPSTTDLVQHLIEHSDTNTAMKRKPPTFPRKYKRRRKLKPHELERLQSSRRKAKPKRKTRNDDEEEQEEEEEGDDDGGSRLDGSNTAPEPQCDDGKPTGGAIVRSNPDGTLKTNRELFLEYGGRGRVSRTPKQTASVSSLQEEMLDQNGINLLSNVVLLHGQQEDLPSKLHNNNHLPESPEQLPPGEMAVKSMQIPSSSRMIYTQKSKPVAAKKPASRKRAAKEPPKAPPAVKMEDEEDPTMAKAMEAFFRDRKRNASLLPEIPPHRISSVGFPLLDDGNTDDPMDEPEQQHSRRSATISFSASEDDLNQQLLMEISHKNKYTDRFNSDTVNDLEEILRSPMKGAARTTQVPSATAAKQSGGNKRTTSNQRKQKAKPKGKPASSGASNKQQQKPIEKKIAPERPAVLRSQRLTRRQLELEVQFLKEAFETDPEAQDSAADSTGTGKACPSSGKMVVKQETNDIQPGNAVLADTMERLDGSEQLAAMLLNDGLPNETGNGCSSGGESSRRSSSSVSHRQEHKLAAEGSYAEGLHMMESRNVIKKEEEADEDDEDEDDELDDVYLHDTSATSATTPKAEADEPMYRCSICAACFDDRAQLILHVPVHI